MAEKELWKLCQTAKNKYPSIGRITAVHILGDCPVGAASVISCASSPHRKDAIHTIEYLIDALKATVPIWKREVYAGSESVWKENIEWHQGKPTRIMIPETQP
jgi:molybdopterin synthase catalytic subunit